MGGWWCTLDYSISSGPFLSFEIEIGDGPGPQLDNINIMVTWKILFIVINIVMKEYLSCVRIKGFV